MNVAYRAASMTPEFAEPLRTSSDGGVLTIGFLLCCLLPNLASAQPWLSRVPLMLGASWMMQANVTVCIFSNTGLVLPWW